jgi:hypothetical protein
MRDHVPHVSRFAFFSLLIGLGAAMAMTPTRGDEKSDHQAKLNGGYYLLHNLSEDEAQVPLLLDVKHAPDEVVTYADRISRTAKETVAALEHLQKSEPSIQFNHNPLPQIERDTRASIKDDKQHQLLFGTTNSEFVRAFLVAQIEACSYAINLSKVLAEQETDPDRAKTLRHISTQWLGQRNEAFRILRNY